MPKPSRRPQALAGTKSHQEIIPKNITPVALPTLRQEYDLWFSLKYLIYDLNNINDPTSALRLGLTVHPLYISEPYFSSTDATRILSITIDHQLPVPSDSSDDADAEDAPDDTPPMDDGPLLLTSSILTVESALHERLKGFLEKRKASGDARPCGPHDMFPIYCEVFGISKER
ncbi:MAG: hypothetical protein Q9218_008220 [Villophora microphyllina]